MGAVRGRKRLGPSAHPCPAAGCRRTVYSPNPYGSLRYESCPRSVPDMRAVRAISTVPAAD